MPISRGQMKRELYGVGSLVGREKFGLGSSLKKFVRKIIPNEVAEVAVKAAPFVAPFNPLLAGGMSALGSFDQTGSISQSVKSGLINYGLGQGARYLGGAELQKGLNLQLGQGQGLGSYFSSPIGAPTPTPEVISGSDFGQFKEPVFGADDILGGEMLGTGGTQVSTSVAKTVTPGFKESVSKLFSGDFTQMGEGLKELGGKAVKAIYTDKDGNIDKLAVGATIAGGANYLEARKLAKEAELVTDEDEYTEEMYEADKQAYLDKYSKILTPAAFGLKDGGRVNYAGGGLSKNRIAQLMSLLESGEIDEDYKKQIKEEIDQLMGKYQSGGRVKLEGGGKTDYWATVTEMFIKAGGEKGTGMSINDFAEKYFPKMQDGGRVKLELGSVPGGIPSIKLKEKKDYNFMELIDEDSEEEYYKKKAEELDKKYNPQNYNDIIPKEKPMDQYMLNEIMSERGMNTLSEDTRDKVMKMYAERAYKKGQISEDEYREIMGFKVGGRVGYKVGTTPVYLKDSLFKDKDYLSGMKNVDEVEELLKALLDEKRVPTKKEYEKGIESYRSAQDKMEKFKDKYIDRVEALDYENMDPKDRFPMEVLVIEKMLEDRGNRLDKMDTDVGEMINKMIQYKKDGGRIGYAFGTDREGIMGLEKELDQSTIYKPENETPKDEMDELKDLRADAPGITFSREEKSYLFRTLAGQGGSERSFTMPQLYGILNNPNTDKNIGDAKALKAFLKMKGFKKGGRVQYAMGSEVPLRENAGGITELDYRNTGGFVPIGVKEKADDVPAMLSKNEFVFTADAVRAAGGGSVNKGAQRMYNLMKSLENKVV